MTLFTTTLVGAHMQYNFTHNLPFFEVENYLDIFTLGSAEPGAVLLGTAFLAHAAYDPDGA